MTVVLVTLTILPDNNSIKLHFRGRMETVLNTIICLPLMSQSHYESNYSSFPVCVYGVFIICICLNPLPGGKYTAY